MNDMCVSAATIPSSPFENAGFAGAVAAEAEAGVVADVAAGVAVGDMDWSY